MAACAEKGSEKRAATAERLGAPASEVESDKSQTQVVRMTDDGTTEKIDRENGVSRGKWVKEPLERQLSFPLRRKSGGSRDADPERKQLKCCW